MGLTGWNSQLVGQIYYDTFGGTARHGHFLDQYLRLFFGAINERSSIGVSVKTINNSKT
jgi:hypothetical protein